MQSILMIVVALFVSATVAQAADWTVIPWQPGRYKDFLKAWPEEKQVEQTNGEIRVLLRPVKGASGPTPYVVFLHGCGGWDASLADQWVKIFNAARVGVVEVDSFTTRSIKNNCESPDKWGPRRSDDAHTALDWLIQQKLAVPDKVVVMGQSNGGTTAWFALDTKISWRKNRFAAAVIMYGGCQHAERLGVQINVPAFYMIGSGDLWPTPEACRPFVTANEKLVHFEVCPGAVHAFDREINFFYALNKYPVGGDRTCRNKAHALVTEFLKQKIGAAPPS